jgi:hypothetical protein
MALAMEIHNVVHEVGPQFVKNCYLKGSHKHTPPNTSVYGRYKEGGSD